MNPLDLILSVPASPVRAVRAGLFACFLGLGSVSTASADPGDTAVPDGQLGSAIESALRETALDAVWQVGTPFPGVEAAWQAPNRAQGLRTFFLEDGFRVVPREVSGEPSGEDWSFGLVLSDLARGEHQQAAGAAALAVDGDRVEYRRGALVEWYVNRPVGIEQGFHVATRPLAEAGAGPLELGFALRGDLGLAHVAPDEVRLAAPDGEVLLTMRELHAFDADGRTLACSFARNGERLALVVDDRGATYPVTIDPLIASESGRLDVTLPPPRDGFGTSIDVHGSLAIVGASQPSGVAYIFREVAGEWRLDAKLFPETSQAGSSFGRDVTIRGDLAVVGAPNDNELDIGAGAVYAYSYDGSEWGYEAKRVSTSAETNGQYGNAVEMISGWLFVGAPREDGTAGDSGTVHVYKRFPQTWVLFDIFQPQGGGGAHAGQALAADGLYLAVGAPGLGGSIPGGSVHVYASNVTGTAWSLADTLTASFAPDLGAAVAIRGNLIAASTPHFGPSRGGVLFFRREVGNTWAHFDSEFGQSDGERFGRSVAMDDATGAVRVIAGSPFDSEVLENAGSATVMKFDALQGNVVFESKVRATVPNVGAQFGVAVALSGTQAFVGAELGATSGTERSGNVQRFEKVGEAWTAREAWQGHSPDPFDHFGWSVAIEGDLAVVGAPQDDDRGRFTGAAHVFERTGGVWSQTALLSGIHVSAARGRFGNNIVTDGERILVAAPFETSSGLGDSGAAYVFERVPGGWSRTGRLTPPRPFQYYGTVLALQGDLAAIGRGSGSVFVYRRGTGGGPAGEWEEDEEVEGLSGANFGAALAFHDGALLVGAPQEGPGVVHRYVRTPDGWEVVQTLEAPTAGAFFGWSLSVSADTLAVGAPRGEVPAVHLYDLEQGDFVPAGAVHDTATDFGSELDLSGDTLAVGAEGKAFAFQRSGVLWLPTELQVTEGSFDDDAMMHVAASGETVLLGYHRGFPATRQVGSAYLYDLPSPDPIQPFGFGDGTVRPCPCGNDTAVGAGEGCANSTGSGARLRASGSASLAADDLVVTADQIPPGRSTQLFIGENRLIGLPFGDGLRIATVPFIRIPIRQSSGAGSVDWSGLHATGFWGPGDVRFLQAFYRDPGGPCGSGFNVTNALQIVFAP